MLNHDQVQAALSSRMDGESYALSDDVIDSHVAGCAQCQEFRDRAAQLSRRLNFVEPDGSGMAPPKDLSEVIIAGVEPEWRRASSARQTSLAVARIAVAIMGAFFGAWAITMLISSFGLAPTSADGTVLAPTADPRLASQLAEGAAVRLAIASALFFAAWRPASASGLLPLTCTLFLFMFGFTMRDIALGQLAATQMYLLVATGLTSLALAATWAADRGYFIRQAWRSLSANPN